jgi:hypothetical protein
MRKVALIGTAIVFGLTGTAWAGAKDKSSNTLIDRNGVGVIDNTTAKTKVKAKGCKLQIQAQTVNMADGEIAICIAEADVDSIADGANQVILTGEAKAGKLKIKADLSEVDIGGLGCGSVEALSYNGQVKCYEDDATFRNDANIPGSWRDNCSGLESAAPGATMLKVNNTVPVVVGLCQFLTIGTRMTPPASAEWALTGQRTAIE